MRGAESKSFLGTLEVVDGDDGDGAQIKIKRFGGPQVFPGEVKSSRASTRDQPPRLDERRALRPFACIVARILAHSLKLPNNAHLSGRISPCNTETLVSSTLSFFQTKLGSRFFIVIAEMTVIGTIIRFSTAAIAPFHVTQTPSPSLPHDWFKARWYDRKDRTS